VKVAKPIRGQKILPFSIAEVNQVAEQCRRWGPLVLFMADSGARPAEALALEHKHVDLDAGTVELPGMKTDLASRTVHLTRAASMRSAASRAHSRRDASSTSTADRSAGTTFAARCGRRR
jgi:integrase